MKPGLSALVFLFGLMSFSCMGIAQPPAAKSPVVCIDPGHPSEVNSGLTVQNGTTETHIDWVVAQKLREILVARGIKVVLTKSSEKQLVKNKERALIANRAHADLMVRLHCDSSPDQGYAVYFPDRQGTAQGKTGPSQEVMDRSREAAKILDKAMSASLGGILKNGGVRGDSQTLIGGKQGALTGSIFSHVPVLTIEMVVLSHKADAALIQTEAGQNKMAQALADGIVQYVLLSQGKANRKIDRKNLATIAAAQKQQRNIALAPGDMALFQETPITAELLRGLSLHELRVLRNEVYARRGKRFRTKWIQDHFEDEEWYHPHKDFNEPTLGAVEAQNVATIVAYEKEARREGAITGA